MLKRNQRLKVFVFIAALLLACAPVLTAAPTPAPPPIVFDPSSLNTVVAQTAAAAATQTFAALPTSTFTAIPTKTPTEPPTQTPTFIFVIFTPTVPSLTPTLEISSSPFACRLASQNPANNSVLAKDADFAALWRVINVGTNAWDANSVDYHYFDGAKLHKSSIYDLPTSVPTGGQIDIIVNMKAPKNEGAYQTTWALRVGDQDFCKLNLTIEVR
jgi:hypothetical protein